MASVSGLKGDLDVVFSSWRYHGAVRFGGLEVKERVMVHFHTRYRLGTAHVGLEVMSSFDWNALTHKPMLHWE